MLFIGQSAPDIRKKLQRANGAGGMSISQLIEIAYKVYNNREERERKERFREKQKGIKLQALLLAAAIAEGPSGNRRRGRGKGRTGWNRVE